MSNDRSGPDRGPDRSELARAVAGLIAHADQCDADRARLDGHIRELADMVTELGTIGPAHLASWLDPTTWPETGPDHPTILGALTTWIERVYLRYPDAALPSCWMWHPGVVEELLTLWRLWEDVRSVKRGSPARIAEWHQIYRPGLVKRLKDSSAGSCDLIKHTKGEQPEDCEVTPAPLSGWTAEIADAWARHGWVPPPNPDMLAEAERLVHPHHCGGRP